MAQSSPAPSKKKYPMKNSQDDSDTVADAAITLTHDHGSLDKGMPIKVRRNIDAAFIGLRAHIKRAHRFVVEDDMLDAVIEAGNAQPNVIQKRLPLAMLPFDTTWIEFDTRVRLQTQSRLGTSGPPEKDQYRMGYLLERGAAEQPAWTAMSFVQTTDKRVSPSLIQHGFRLPLPPQMSEVDDKEGPYELGRKAWGWVGPFPEDFEHLLWTVPTDLWCVYGQGSNSRGREFWADAVLGAANEQKGDARFLVTLLAVINHTPIEYKEVQARGSHQVRFRNVPFLDHSVIKIHAGRKNVVYLIDKTLKKAYQAHARHRAHEVRGHHRVLHKGLPNERTTWVKEHTRGDASLGWVKQTWSVQLSDAREMLP